MNPASVMKLVTTYAALELLGPAYRWKTEVYAAGTLADGVLEGDLFSRATAIRSSTCESFWMLLRALRGKGLREIRGDLVLDRSWFERSGGDAARFDGDPFRPYNVAARRAAGQLQVAALRLPAGARARARCASTSSRSRPALEVVNAAAARRRRLPRRARLPRPAAGRLRARAPRAIVLRPATRPPAARRT